MIRENSRNGSLGGVNYNSLQLAKVKSTKDVNHSGRLQVWLSGSNTNENDEANWISIKYSSPMGGVTPRKDIDSGKSQKSYGFYSIPGVDNMVMIGFANGSPDRGYFISSTIPDGEQHGMGGSKDTVKDGKGGSGLEPNALSEQPLDIQNPHQRTPYDKGNEYIDTDKQELSSDELLGAGKTSMYRDDDHGQEPVTIMQSPGGSQFIMDDANGYQLIRLRTASGAQLLISETTGDIFMISKGGNNWVKMGNGGDVDMYSSVSVNIFGGSDINLKAGSNINLEAGSDINIKAGSTASIEGGGTVSLKAPPWSVISSQITADVYSALSAAQAPPGAWVPIGDAGAAAGSVSRTPSRGGKAT